MRKEEQGEDEKRHILRAAIGPHTARWAEGKGLLMQLNSLEQAWPHLFALPAAAHEGEERPWVARDESNSALEKAYKRAALHLHPDRLVSQNRDLSVRVEAEEVFKELQTAYSDKPSWLKGKEAANPFATEAAAAGGGASQPHTRSSSCTKADELFGGASTSGGGDGGSSLGDGDGGSDSKDLRVSTSGRDGSPVALALSPVLAPAPSPGPCPSPSPGPNPQPLTPSP